MGVIEGVLLPRNLAELVDLDISPAALVFASAVTIATVLLCGALPALKSSRSDPGSVIKRSGASALGARARGRLRGGLLPVQIALAVALLVLAGLFMRSLINVSRVELGMDVEPVVTFSVAPLIAGYDAGRVDPLYDEITRRLEAEPGIRSVASAVIPPLSGVVIPANIADRAGGQAPFTQSVPLTSPNVFDTLSIPFAAGRDFAPSDIQPTPLVAIVNEAFVRAHDLGEEPVGQFVRVAGPLVQATVEVIGVVRDAHYSSIKGPVLPQLFTPRVPANTTFQLRFFYLKTDADPDALMARIPRIVAEIDPSVPVTNLATFSRWARDNSWGDRLIASLTTSFAMLATLLTAIGLHGVLSYNIARRTREFGLRIALGAQPRRLLIGVFKQVGTTALIGLGTGLALGIVLGALAAGMLYGFAGDDDIVVLLGAVLVIGIVVSSASYLPARRASRIQPVQALRYD
jgi:predicted permease